MSDSIKKKRGQVTIFVIIGVVIIAAVLLTILLWGRFFNRGDLSEFAEVYNFYDDCIELKTREALAIAGMQGGYIEVPQFEPGNEYSPFSSQLDFLGIPVPYWYYVSGNGFVKEQVPSQNQIQRQISDFLEDELRNCDFTELRRKGYIINAGSPTVNTQIASDSVRVSVRMNLAVEREDSRAVKRDHVVDVRSRFGDLYQSALRVYEKEKREAFLENYTLDAMYNYAPVTGVEITCEPQIWKAREVVDDLKQGISGNIETLRISENKGYFDVSVATRNSVSFKYDTEWPTRISIWPADGELLVAEPEGLQAGMGILGFCYVPYHFVYDIYHPVLIQVSNGDEIFQFPVSVIIDKSVPREAIDGVNLLQDSVMDDFCNYKNTKVDVYTYDSELRPVESRIYFVCASERCTMGETEVKGSDAILSTEFPQCANGKIIARAEGYNDAERIISTNQETFANLMMDKIYEIDLDVILAGLPAQDLVVINFVGDKHSTSVVYPNQKSVGLINEYYKISIQAFGDASLVLPASSTRQCVQVPRGGLGGFFGFTTESCHDIELPQTRIEKAIIGGGNAEYYFTEEELKSAKKLTINVPSLPRATSIEQLQKNYEMIFVNRLEVRLN